MHVKYALWGKYMYMKYCLNAEMHITRYKHLVTNKNTPGKLHESLTLEIQQNTLNLMLLIMLNLY